MIDTAPHEMRYSFRLLPRNIVCFSLVYVATATGSLLHEELASPAGVRQGRFLIGLLNDEQCMSSGCPSSAPSKVVYY